MTQQTRIWATGPSGEVLPVVCDAQGNLVIQLEGATVNVGDVDVISSALPTGAATSAKQDTGNNSLSVIENETHLRDLGSAVHLSGNASSQSVAIPSGTRAIFVASTGGVSNLMLNGDAGASTSPIVYQNGYLTYPIDDTDDLYCYAGVGTDTYINFLG